MKQIKFSWQHSGVAQDKIQAIKERLKPECERIKAAWGAGYSDEYASLSLPSDDNLLATVQEVVAQKRQLKTAVLVIIGMGGSSLGARAVYHALRSSAVPSVYFLDTLDGRYCQEVYKVCEAVLQAGKEILITVISKSGTTTETIANAQLFIKLLAEYNKPYQEYVVAITDEDSPLWNVARTHAMSCLSVPKLVGGRYSVFSAVGLFPLGMMGFDLVALRDGAQSMKESCSDTTIMNNPAAMSAAILYEQYRAGFVIHDTFLFSRPLHAVADWYRQLVGESLGKADNRQGKRVNVGITPTVSVGPEDLHSVAQLYLGGPYNRITSFLSTPQEGTLAVTTGSPFDELVPMIRGKSFAEIMDAIERGTQKAYEHDKRPFMMIALPEISAYTIGQFMQLKMVEIMYLGFLFDINPFDQPQVELYKKETREILDHE